MKILPVISPKGGEGKLTFAAYLAGFLADAGVKALLIDADWTQPTASSISLLIKKRRSGCMGFSFRRSPTQFRLFLRPQ